MKHAMSIIVLADGRYRACCSCGWKGPRVIPGNRPVAEAHAEAHLDYHRDVARITAPPEHGRQG